MSRKLSSSCCGCRSSFNGASSRALPQQNSLSKLLVERLEPGCEQPGTITRDSLMPLQEGKQQQYVCERKQRPACDLGLGRQRPRLSSHLGCDCGLKLARGPSFAHLCVSPPVQAGGL